MIDNIRGRQFGVKFVDRGKKDQHICIQLQSSDDDNWFNMHTPFSSHWLDDIIQVLVTARSTLETQASVDGTGYGWKRKQ